MAPSADCERMGRADGAPRLQPLRRTRRRLGSRSDELDGQAACFRTYRRSSESSDSFSASTTAARRLYSRRPAGACPTRQVWERRVRLWPDPGNPTPNTRVRSCRLTGWASDVDIREVSGMERQQG